MALRDIRPYMLHAHIQWLDDSNEFPHIVVLNGPGVAFPPHLRDAPHLLFNVSSEACQGLEINDEGVSFSGRFGGRVFKIECPLNAVAAVQNKAATLIVSFTPQEEMGVTQSSEPSQSTELQAASGKPHLSLVPGGEAEANNNAPPTPKRGLHLVKAPDDKA